MAVERERVISAASDLFDEIGFRSTTLSAIADRADVEVETVVAVGTKADLALAAYRSASRDLSAWTKDADQHAWRFTDPDNHRALELFVDYICETVERRYRLWCAVQAAVIHEPYKLGLLRELTSARRASTTLLAGILIGRGLWPVDSDQTALAAHFGVALSLETYGYLTDVWNYDGAQYRAYVTEALTYRFESGG